MGAAEAVDYSAGSWWQSGLIEPEQPVPMAPRGVTSCRELEPVIRFARASLEEACLTIRDGCRELAHTGRISRGVRRNGTWFDERLWQDLVWVFEEDGAWRDKYGASFERLCEAVGIDPDSLRWRLREMCQAAWDRGADARARQTEAPDAVAISRRRRGRPRVESLELFRRCSG